MHKYTCIKHTQWYVNMNKYKLDLALVEAKPILISLHEDLMGVKRTCAEALTTAKSLSLEWPESPTPVARDRLFSKRGEETNENTTKSAAGRFLPFRSFRGQKRPCRPRQRRRRCRNRHAAPPSRKRRSEDRWRCPPPRSPPR